MGEFQKPEDNCNPLTEEFGNFAKEILDEWKVPGISIAVIDDDDVFAEGYGIASYPDIPATPETIWYAGSMTKAFVGAVLAHLIDTKEFPQLRRGWATPISSILRDDFVVQDAWATEHLTLEDAVCHRTGLPRHDKSSSRYLDDDHGPIIGADGRRKRRVTVRDHVRNLRSLRMTAEPRSKFQYCNLMYKVLAHVIETLTEKPLADVMRDLVWEPLGMSSTYFDLDEALAGPEHFAAGYSWDSVENEFVEAPRMPVFDCSGAGAIISNCVDFAKWIRCMLDQSTPFSEAAHKDIRMPRILSGMPECGKDVSMYGLGWERTLYRGHVMYSHGGGMHAYGSHSCWFPESRFGIVVFGNTAMSSNAVADILMFELINKKLNIPPHDRANMNARWKGIDTRLTTAYEKAQETIYPVQPAPPLPSPVSIEELVGTYYDPGYKSITLRIEPHPDKPQERILVADRPDTTWQFRFLLHHVSGTWWVLYMQQGFKNPSKFFKEFQKAEFKIGPDGKPIALIVELWSRMSHMYEGVTEFKRVA